MRFDRKHSARAVLLVLSFAMVAASAVRGQGDGDLLPQPKKVPTPSPTPSAVKVEPWPAWLPRYDVGMDLDLANHCARAILRATWTNPQSVATKELIFNAHSRYVIPNADIGLTAKTLELLRLAPGDAMGVKNPSCDIHRITLPSPSGPPVVLNFRYEGDTKTTLVVPLPRAVGPGESVTVTIELTMHLPPKQGRWGQWEGVTTLSNWLPVFAYYGPRKANKMAKWPGDKPAPKEPAVFASSAGQPVAPAACAWQPTPFLPWHQPFFNEAAHYRVRATLPADQQIACTGSIVARRRLGDDRQQVDILAPGVRDFAFLCSARYRVFDGFVPTPVKANPLTPNPSPPSTGERGERGLTPNSSPPSTGERGDKPAPQGVRIRILAFPEHEHYAREMVQIATKAIAAYSKWFGPYPWPEFTIAEAFFGWNGNECSTLVMIDSRIFGMPHLAGNFVDYLVSHEICHQWWYNQVGTNGFRETWMDEGLATYFSHRLLNEKVGKNNNMMTYPRGLGWLPNIPRETYRSYGLYGTLARGDNGPVIQPMSGYGHVVNLFSLAYDKGSRIVGLIEDRLGPTVFLDFMRGVFHRYRYRILRVADFQHELEAYTGQSWEEFFQNWLYGPGLTDWCIEKVKVQAPPKCVKDGPVYVSPRNVNGMALAPAVRRDPRSTRVVVFLNQKADINEQTVVGVALPGQQGFPIRIPILPRAEAYDWDEPPAHIEPLGNNRVRVEMDLAAAPAQIAVDPDQILVDRNPVNNLWKPKIRYRVTPIYTFLEETDITTAYDRWNVIVGPWIYGTAYYDAWYTRTTATMVGFRAGLYRTQAFTGGVYAGYRTDYRDVVAGVDGLFDHWPDSHFQIGFDVEQRLAQFLPGQLDAKRGVLFGRYIFKYGSSLYLPPMEFLESFVTYQDNFLPFDNNPTIQGVRFNRTATAGFHYRKDYLTPYWNPEGGFRYDLWYEGGAALEPQNVGMQKVSTQLSFVQSFPDFSNRVAGIPWLSDPLSWLGQSRIALRAYGGTSQPARGEFFSMGGSMYFRGFDLAQRQGSTLWVCSAEWRLPVARNLHLDACDHVFSLHNIDVVPFYDVGNIYNSGHSFGPTAHAAGTSFRFDVSWFGFVERTLLRFDIAKALSVSSPVQFWFGVGVPL